MKGPDGTTMACQQRRAGLNIGARSRAVHTIPSEETMAQVKDPVCGMTVDDATAVDTSEYQAKRYYFCSTDCKVEFDENPDDYAERA